MQRGEFSWRIIEKIRKMVAECRVGGPMPIRFHFDDRGMSITATISTIERDKPIQIGRQHRNWSVIPSPLHPTHHEARIVATARRVERPVFIDVNSAPIVLEYHLLRDAIFDDELRDIVMSACLHAAKEIYIHELEEWFQCNGARVVDAHKGDEP